jgi:hypothetical protein
MATASSSCSLPVFFRDGFGPPLTSASFGRAPGAAPYGALDAFPSTLLELWLRAEPGRLADDDRLPGPVATAALDGRAAEFDRLGGAGRPVELARLSGRPGGRDGGRDGGLDDGRAPGPLDELSGGRALAAEPARLSGAGLAPPSSERRLLGAPFLGTACQGNMRAARIQNRPIQKGMRLKAVARATRSAHACSRTSSTFSGSSAIKIWPRSYSQELNEII